MKIFDFEILEKVTFTGLAHLKLFFWGLERVKLNKWDTN